MNLAIDLKVQKLDKIDKNIKFLKNLVNRSKVFYARMEKLGITKPAQMKIDDLRECVFLLQQNKLD